MQAFVAGCSTMQAFLILRFPLPTLLLPEPTLAPPNSPLAVYHKLTTGRSIKPKTLYGDLLLRLSTLNEMNNSLALDIADDVIFQESNGDIRDG